MTDPHGPPLPASADVVIVGGAAVGSSVAYHLLADPGFKGRVVVLERDPTYRLSASALSAASIRQQFSSAVNIRISLYGIAFLRAAEETLAVDGTRPAIGLHEGGYLYLATEAGWPGLAANHAVQQAEGADILLLERDGLARRFPWLATGDLAGGSFGRSGEGWFDGWGLLQALRGKARALGATYVTGSAAAVDHAAGRVTGLTLADGRRIATGTVVACAGAGTAALAATAGLDLPVRAKRRNVFTFACPQPLDGVPLLIDPTGVYVRPEGRAANGDPAYLCGVSPGAGDTDPDWTDDAATHAVDHALFQERIWPVLAQRVPAFETLRPGRAWTGPYDMCALDHNAILGPAGPRGFHLATGFSGHGLQQAPAVGRGLAEQIVHGGWRSLDLGDLGWARVEAGRPLMERNVI